MFAIFFTTTLTREAKAQYELPVITNERGDTIHYSWPLPDSALCIKDEIIIKFKPNALYLDKLCFNFTPGPPATGDPSLDWYYQQKSVMMSQEFPIDTLIADSALREAIKGYGGIYLTRITAASPCTDTISITRFGDTIPSAGYLWMLLKLNNDTSVINACIGLTIAYQNLLDGAEPNYCIKLFFEPPNPDEPYYHSLQKSLWTEWTNVEPAWIMQRGSPDIAVGIIDNGIHYKHPDLGGGFGQGFKIAGGWNFQDKNQEIDNTYDPHGTKIAGIIGGITNGPYPVFGVDRNGCNTTPSTGIAGIAGGWWPSNLGCTLFGYLISYDLSPVPVSNAIGAIHQAATGRGIPFKQSEYGGQGYGDGVSILNCSWGIYNQYSEGLRDQCNYAYENGASIVVARGNEGKDYENYPSCFDPTWITSVGGVGNSQESGLPEHARTGANGSESSFGHSMDLLAPAIGSLVYTTSYCVFDGFTLKDSWYEFDGTSASAPHVTGAIALLRSEFLEHPEHFIPSEGNDKGPEPEDYENMLKAAARDLNYGLDPGLLMGKIYSYTLPGYDTTTGWGELDIGKIFWMLQNGYVLKHYIIDYVQGENYPEDFSDLLINRIENKRRDCSPGLYKAKRREITGSLTLENYWIMSEETPLYVWGRNGRSATKGGFSASNPLYLTSYTEVTSGTGGNDIVPGIIHSYDLNGLTVNAKTYQYQLYTLDDPPQYIQDLPIDNNLKLYISVFGKRDFSDIQESYAKSLTIYPNPATNTITLKFAIDIPIEPIIQIYNELGIVVYKEKSEILMPGNYDRIINISSLPSGVYLIEINQGTKQTIHKLIIKK